MYKSKKYRLFTLNTVMYALTGLMVGLLIYSFNAKTVMGEKMPMPFGYGISVVVSGSMEPALQINDGIIVKELKETDRIATDDIIVFEADNMLIVHRVIAVNDNEIITKGDANNTEDSPIIREQIKGKVIYRFPGLGGFLWLIRQPSVILLILFMLFLSIKTSDDKEKDKGNRELQEIMEEINRLKDELK